MRASALVVGLSCASIICSALSGCSWKKLLPAEAPTLPNAVAVDRALRLCSLSEGDQPFHLILEISPPAISPAAGSLHSTPPRADHNPMQATVEIFWLNPITYRTEIRSPGFRQTRIVNGSVVEEHNIGDYYPRWIQDFVEGILNPVPEAARLRRVPGDLPVGLQSDACISTSANRPSPDSAQLCFRDTEPRLAGITDARRSLWFDDYAPFGSQQIPRTIVDNLQPNLLIRGHIVELRPLSSSSYRLLKATYFTPPAQQLATAAVSPRVAEVLLQLPVTRYSARSAAYSWQPIDQGSSPELTPPSRAEASPSAAQPAVEQTPIYVRTDRTGRVREAYRSPSDHYGIEKAALVRALTLHFKPLIIDGAPRQMEALLYLPNSLPAGTLIAGSPRPRFAPAPPSPALPSPTPASIVQSTPEPAYSTRPSHARPASPETQPQTPATAPQTSGPDQAAAPAPLPPEKDKQ